MDNYESQDLQEKSFIAGAMLGAGIVLITLIIIASFLISLYLTNG